MTYSYEEYRVFYYVNQLQGWAESNCMEEDSFERGLYYWTKGYRLKQPPHKKGEAAGRKLLEKGNCQIGRPSP